MEITKQQETDIIARLYTKGYFFDPLNQEGMNVTVSDLPSLTLRDDPVKGAVSSIQRYFPDELDMGVAHHHKRKTKAVPDGELAEATLDVLDYRDSGCPVPDFVPPDDVSFAVDDPEIDKVIKSMQAASGSGSWPPPCQKEGVTFSVDMSGCPPKTREWWPKIEAAFIAIYASVGLKLVREDKPGANIRISWRVLAGSTIGLGQFMQGSCSDSVFHHLDPGYQPSLANVLRLVVHEGGHNMGLQHRRGIMSSVVANSPPFQDFWPRNDSSYPVLKTWFGGEPLEKKPVEPDPDPPITPTTETIVIPRGSTLVAPADLIFTTKKSGDDGGSGWKWPWE